MNRILLTLIFAATFVGAAAQSITLDDCRARAAENYPLRHNADFLASAFQYNISNAQKGRLPQITISGKATYQSDVTGLPIELPGVDVPTLRKDQYNLVAEVSQTLYDGGAVKADCDRATFQNNADNLRQQADMYEVMNRVTKVYFAILTIDAQMEQNAILRGDLRKTLHKISALKDNGMANQSDIDRIEVQMIKTAQDSLSLRVLRKGYVNVLAAFYGSELDENIVLQIPSDVEPQPMQINRYELQLLDTQKEYTATELKSLKTLYSPKIAAFVQGGVGNPALNMLKDEFAPYYVAGVRLNWNISAFYRNKNNRAIISQRADEIEMQKDLFCFNTNINAINQNAEIENITSKISDDAKIISLRESIRKNAEIRVENGTMSVSDLLDEMTAESVARQTLKIHEIELLQKKYELKHTLGQ